MTETTLIGCENNFDAEEDVCFLQCDNHGCLQYERSYGNGWDPIRHRSDEFINLVQSRTPDDYLPHDVECGTNQESELHPCYQQNLVCNNLDGNEQRFQA